MTRTVEGIQNDFREMNADTSLICIGDKKMSWTTLSDAMSNHTSSNITNRNIKYEYAFFDKVGKQSYWIWEPNWLSDNQWQQQVLFIVDNALTMCFVLSNIYIDNALLGNLINKKVLLGNLINKIVFLGNLINNND